jgi:hypothetical protein
MKTSHILAAAALSLLAAAGAHAQALATANAPDQNVTGGSRVNSRVISTMPNRADTLQQAQKQGAPAAK